MNEARKLCETVYLPLFFFSGNCSGNLKVFSYFLVSTSSGFHGYRVGNMNKIHPWFSCLVGSWLTWLLYLIYTWHIVSWYTYEKTPQSDERYHKGRPKAGLRYYNYTQGLSSPYIIIHQKRRTGPRISVNPWYIGTCVKKKCKIILLGKSRNSIFGGHLVNVKRFPQQRFDTVKTEVKKTFPQLLEIELSHWDIYSYGDDLTR